MDRLDISMRQSVEHRFAGLDEIEGCLRRLTATLGRRLLFYRFPCSRRSLAMASDAQPTINSVAGPGQGYDMDEKKGVADVSSHLVAEEEPEKQIKDFPLAWKLTALACGIALSWGSSFSENILGPLKSTLKKELDIDNAQVRKDVRETVW